MLLRSGTRLVALLLCILAPLPGAAQSAAPETEPPSLPLPPLVPAPEEPAPIPPRGSLIPRQQPGTQEPKYGLVPRVGFELVSGALGGAALGAPGALILLARNRCHDESCTSLRTLGGGLLLVAGGTVGMAAGITLAGNSLGAHGHFEFVYAFEAACLLSVAAKGRDPSAQMSDVAYAGTLFGLTLALGIMGYEFTRDTPSSSPPRVAHAGGWLLPTVGVSAHGIPTGGLAGTF